MKRVFSLLLLLLFLFNLGGVFLIFKYEQSIVRSEIKQRLKQDIPETDLTVIVQTDQNQSEIAWQHASEFIYNGQCFDVVRKETAIDGSVRYYCINDLQEEVLYANLEEHVRNQMNDENNTGSGKTSFQKSVKDYFFSQALFSFCLFPSVTEFQDYCYSLSCSSPETAVPPPDPAFVV